MSAYHVPPLQQCVDRMADQVSVDPDPGLEYPLQH